MTDLSRRLGKALPVGVETLRRVRAGRDRAVAVIFGDRVGLTLYLGFLLFLVLTWRTGPFFNDVNLFAQTIERLATGQLSLGTPTEIENLDPGMHVADGKVYARNYGEVALSVPAFWIVELVGPVAFQAVVIVAWSILALAVAVRIAGHFDRRQLGIAVGTAVATGAVVANAVTFRSSFDGQSAFVALQVTTMLVAAFTGVLVYRLIARDAGTKLGVFAGAVVVFATPVGFWATIPKRHAFAATLAVVALCGLARSREEPVPSARLGTAGFRGLAYASAGVLAWIHAPEGFTLLLAVAVVDLPTAPRNDRHTLAVVAGAFALSLVPFLLTNYLVSGNPFDPPRFLPVFEGVEATSAAETSASGDGGGEGPDLVAAGLDSLFPSALASLLRRGMEHYVEGFRLLFRDPGRLVTIFLRWGRHGYDPTNQFFGNGTNLAVVEAAPVVGALLVRPVRGALAAVRERTPPTVDTPDLFVVVFSVLLLTLYVLELPVRVQVTVRYLHPLYPLFVYALFRQQWLRDALASHTGHALWGYEAVVLLGVPLAIGLLLLTSVGKGQFVQFFSPVALLAAAAFVTSATATALTGPGSGRLPRVTSLSFGLASGVGTAFLLLTAFVLMHYGPSALPFVEVVTAEVRFAVIRLG